MEWFLAQCGAVISSNYPVWLSVLMAGLLASITHCSFMCAPVVASHVMAHGIRAMSWSMLFFHFGRITTYSLLGVIAVLAGQWLFAFGGDMLMHGAMLAAGVIFLISAIRPRQTHKTCCSSETKKQPLHFTDYYVRGLFMGFMPCGMTLAALLMVSTLSNAMQAGLAMALFGLATTPVLQLVGLGARKASIRYPNATQWAGRGMMTLNGLLLCGIGMNLVTMS